MLTKKAVLRHYSAVQQLEIDAFDSGILERATYLCRTSDIAQDIKDKTVKNTHIYPRLGLRLLSRAFEDLNKHGLTNKEMAAKFISKELLPLCGLDVADDAADMKIDISGGIRGACEQAEYYFKDSLSQIRSGHNKAQPRISVYHTPEGVPLALRKTSDESTALILESSAVIPAGTIASVGPRMNSRISGVRCFMHSIFETYEVNEPLAILPIRLSAWAYENPLDRALFAVEHWEEEPHYDSERANIVKGACLADFKQASRQLMEMCGVAAPQSLPKNI